MSVFVVPPQLWLYMRPLEPWVGHHCLEVNESVFNTRAVVVLAFNKRHHYFGFACQISHVKLFVADPKLVFVYKIDLFITQLMIDQDFGSISE